MAHLKTSEKPACRPAVARAVARGRAMARFFGTSSPKIIENDVAMISARAREMPEATPAPSPVARSSGSRNRARTGSAR